MSFLPDGQDLPTHVNANGDLVFKKKGKVKGLTLLAEDYWENVFRTGAIHGLVTAINEEASRRILEVSPLWRQINDSNEPSPAGAARMTQIKAIRDWSNALAERANAITTVAEKLAVEAELKERVF
jgi:hypothetical protein